ncbi:MAG: GNAT family N-acetyltransferase [Paracoccaceae bacterium]|nr:GNAT family N-acetyltransferase [Paracoccaceae bacterium]
MLSDGFHDVPAGKVAMIVTYLEMTTRVETKNIPLPEGVTFHRATPDLDWYRDIFRRVGSLDWLWFGRLTLDDAALREIIEAPDVEIFTLCRDGRDEALLELDFRQKGACELAYFGLTSELIGTGSGRYLMNEAIAKAWQRPITKFHVHTCTIDSPQALDFYRRSGFLPVRQAVEIDNDPRVSGILPVTAGPNIPLLRP